MFCNSSIKPSLVYSSGAEVMSLQRTVFSLVDQLQMSKQVN